MPLRRALAALVLLAWSLVVVSVNAAGEDIPCTAPHCLAQPLYGSASPCPG